MGKVILICGKTTYAKTLIKNHPTVLLSCDELTTLFFGPNGGAEHHVMLGKTQKYLFEKSLEIIKSGIATILDWGFWTCEERREAKLFYKKNGIEVEWHYIEAFDEVLLNNLIKRNKEIEAGELTSSYYFPVEIARKFWDEMFEVPDENEIDIWYVNQMNGRY